MQLRLHEKPLFTQAAAVYPYSDQLAEEFTAVSRFDDPYLMYREFGHGDKRKIALPRNWCPLGDKDLRVEGAEVKFESIFEPRSSEQSKIVTASAELLKQGKSFITQAPTGFGKTVCAMEVIARVGLKTLVVVTKEDSRDQWYDESKAILGLSRHEVGFIQADQCEVVDRKLVIGTIQSLSIGGRYAPNTYHDIGLTIWDEVHRAAADHFSNSCWALPSKLRWGLSATPWRQDGKEELLYGHIGNIAVNTTELQLVPNVFRVVTDVEFPKGLRFTPDRLGHVHKFLSMDLKRNHFIARFVRKAWGDQRNTIVFADTLNHLDWLMSAIRKVGVPSKDIAYYVGGLSKPQREKAKGKPVILATYAYTSEATDIPWLDTMVMATPRSNVIQIVGRVLREYPGKPNPVILDLVDPLRIFRNFADKRLGWYASIGAKVKGIDYG
jgi:superfamily II DNA or RNA helicase